MDEGLERLLSELDLAEKISLVSGSDMWHTPGIARLGIPPLKLTDGPNGARGGSAPGAGLRAACLPCGSALGATWDVELVRRVGAALGEEARSKGAHVLLAPTVNIHRHPLAGRNFECYSEDPHLSARMAVAFVAGVQSRGVGACIKHFVCNDSEFERHTISSEIAERPLREIYLRPFEAAVREAGVWSLMGAYNKLNGTYACEDPLLLTEILREEWGFDGFVVSDWFATQSAAPAANAGLDLEMPGPPRRFGADLEAAVRAGDVPQAVLDEMVRRVLRARLRTGAFDDPVERPEQAIDRPEHRALARDAAAAAIVVLRNEGRVLPLDPERLSRLAVIGPNAARVAIQGGGSAQVTPHYTVSPLDGIAARCGEGVEIVHERGCSIHRAMPVIDREHLAPDAAAPGSIRTEFFEGTHFEGPAVHVQQAPRIDFTWFEAPVPAVKSELFSVRCTAHFAPSETGSYTFGLTAAGRSRLYVDGSLAVDNWNPSERGDSFFGAGSAERTGQVELVAGSPCEIVVEYARVSAQGPISGLRAGCLLPAPPDQLERAVACAADADAAVVVVGLNREWESEGHDRTDMQLPGRQVELVRRVAAVNPNTVVVLNAGSPLAMDWIDDVPSVLQLWYPGQEGGNALADVLFGDRSPSGRLPTTFPARVEDAPSHPWYPGAEGRVEYGEGVFVGYRHYDAKGVEPRFPFGHGLSYTSFRYGELSLSAEEIGPGDDLEVGLDVTNSGDRAGREVVQLYLRDLQASVPRPEQELAAFDVVSLAPGETGALRFRLGRRALSFWDETAADWRAEPGAFEVRVGASSRDIRTKATFRLVR
jgi:beta-glucosidase